MNIASLLMKIKLKLILIQAFAKKFQQNNPSFQLQIAGIWSFGKLFKRISCNELGIQQQVQFLGQLNRTQVKATFTSMPDVFVLPSTYETFGVVLIEALACGKPVIATACGGPENIVTVQ
ncbi:MAG: glycosyltransferase [Chitinophagaceae bacterium]